jgi:ribosome-associated protein
MRQCISLNSRGNTVADSIDFELKGEFIPLNDLLKTTGIAPSGGEAKAMVADGLVKVDGQLELRKRCKIRKGQVVTTEGAEIRVR